MRRRGSTDGPSFVGRNDAPPPEPLPAEAAPRTPRERLDKLRKDARALLAVLPRAFGLVWSAGKGLTLALALFAVVDGIIPTATAWISKLLVDAVVTAARANRTPLSWRDAVPVIALVAAQLGLYLGGSLLQTARTVVQQALQELTTNRVQLTIMEHANRLDLTFFENPKFYDTLQQAQREASFRPLGMVQGLFNQVRSLITFLGMVALMARLGWVVGLAALIAPIPSFIAGSRYGRQGYWLALRQSPDRRLMGYFLDLLTKDTFNKEIKLFGLGGHFMDRWKVIAERFYRENRTLLMSRSVMGFLWGSLTTLVTSGTFLYVALRVIAGRLTIGDLTLYTQAVGSVQSSFQGFLNGLSSLYESGLYVSNLFDFLDYQPAIRDRPDAIPVSLPLQSGIEFRDVSFTYPGKSAPALRGVSFKIDRDETVALVGQNGAGKTTIVKLLTRLYDPESGQILLNGRDIRDYQLASLHAVIGVIFQDYVHYFFSARENIGVGRLAEIDNRALIEGAAVKSGADAVITQLPNGYDTTLGRWFDEGHQLSGGEWQKVGLARAFMRDAEVLILDEPTASLDARAEYEIFARMQRLTVGKMALFISHRFSTVRLADRILVLENGGVKEDGTHEALLAQNGTYAELFHLQAAAYR